MPRLEYANGGQNLIALRSYKKFVTGSDTLTSEEEQAPEAAFGILSKRAREATAETADDYSASRERVLSEIAKLEADHPAAPAPAPARAADPEPTAREQNHSRVLKALRLAQLHGARHRRRECLEALVGAGGFNGTNTKELEKYAGREDWDWFAELIEAKCQLFRNSR